MASSKHSSVRTRLLSHLSMIVFRILLGLLCFARCERSSLGLHAPEAAGNNLGYIPFSARSDSRDGRDGEDGRRLRPRQRRQQQQQGPTFDAFNDLLDSITLRLPDASVSQNGLDLTITQLSCRDVSLQSIQIRNTFSSSTRQTITLEVLGVEVECNFRWEYKWSFFNGRGSGSGKLDPLSSASIDLSFTSVNYELYPPTNVDVSSCQPRLEIADLDFDGDGIGFIGGIINLFEGLLRGTIESELEELMCAELRDLGNEIFDGILIKIDDYIDDYLGPPVGSNALSKELTTSPLLDGNGDSLYLDFQSMDEFMGGTINRLVESIDDFLSGDGLNDFIAGNFLDSGGYLVIDPAILSPDTEIYDGHDMLTKSTLSIESIALSGLDTFTALDLLNAAGQYTLSNSLKLKRLTIRVKMKAVMQASSLSNAVIVAESEPIEEIFIVEISLNDITLDFSVYLGIDKGSLGELPIGPLLHSENIASCILSTLKDAKFTNIQLSIGDITPPTLSGFLDSGIDYIISSAAESLFKMYEQVAKRALPNFFDIFVKDWINEYIEDSLRLFTECVFAPNMAKLTGIVDFRDFFMDPEEAAASGARGDERYGNLGTWAKDLIDDKLSSSNEDGLLAINDVLIGPVTKSLFGAEGSVLLSGTVVELSKDQVDEDSIWAAFADSARLQLSNVHLEGLNSIRQPLILLQPSASSPYVINNQMNLGPVLASVDLGIFVGDNKSPLSMSNELNLRVDLPSIDLLLSLLAAFDESRVLNFPLNDILEWSCWLSAISEPGRMELSKAAAGLALRRVGLTLSGAVTASSSCVSCTSSWLEKLDPTLLDFLNSNNVIGDFAERAMSIASDLLESAWFQGLIDEQIAAASTRCPHDPSYGLEISDTVAPSFRATRDLVDSVLYIGMAVVEVIAVGVAKEHAEVDVPQQVVELQMDIPKDANLIDLTDLSSVADWVDVALEEGRDYLGSVSENGVLGINNLLSSSLLDDEDGTLTIQLEDIGFESGGVKLTILEVSLIGLDSFTQIDALRAVDPRTLRSQFSLGRLGCEVTMGISVEGEEDEHAEQVRMLQRSGLETVTISLVLADVEVDLSLLLALDQDLLGSLQLGSILSTGNIFYCFLSTLHDVGLSEFVMKVGDIEEFQLVGFVSKETDLAIKAMTQAILDEFEPMILASMPSFTAVTVRSVLDGILAKLLDQGREGACPGPDPSLNGFVDFRDLLLPVEVASNLPGARGDSPYGNVFRMLHSFIDGLLSNSSGGIIELNKVVAGITESFSGKAGELFFLGDVIDKNVTINLNGLNAALALSVSNVTISNIDSLGSPIAILQPFDSMPSSLNNSMTVGVGPDMFNVSFLLKIRGKGEEVEVDNELVLGLSVKEMRAVAEILLQIQEAPFLGFPIRDVTNVRCWLATIAKPILDKYGLREIEEDSGMALNELAMNVAEARLNIDCIECSSPLLLEMAEKFISREGVEDTTKAANDIFHYIARFLSGNFVQNLLDRLVLSSSMMCPHSPSYNRAFAGLKYEQVPAVEGSGNLSGFLVAIIIVLVVILALASAFMLVTRHISRKRHAMWCKSLTREQFAELMKEQINTKDREIDLNNRVTSLALCQEVPMIVRVLMPLIILGNVGLFLSGHLSLGGTVNIIGNFAGQDFNVGGFFEFSVVQSTIEMWQAGAYPLAILIAIFSGVWPYTKQCLSMYIWFSPTKFLSCKKRGRILVWLDLLGKWSMVDVFVLVLTLASFALSIESPSHLSFLPEGLYSVRMLVVPKWGLYANMLAQFVAQISSHVIIHFHRKSVNKADVDQRVEMGLEMPKDVTPSEKLCEHCFQLDHRTRAVVRKGFTRVLISSFFLFALLVILGCSFPSFSKETLGIVGLVIESGNPNWDEASTYYSVFGLARSITEQGRFLGALPDRVGLGTLASLLIVTVLLVPLAQAACLFMMWFVPLTKTRRATGRVMNEILGAWQYTEVYVLSIFITSWQLGGVSEFMINEYCGSLESALNSLAYFDVIDKGDAQCFRVNSMVQSGAWLLLLASFILFGINKSISEAASQKDSDDALPRKFHFYAPKTGSNPAAVSVERPASFEDPSEGSAVLSPISPRFTDIFPFAIIAKIHDIDTIERAETALPFSKFPQRPTANEMNSFDHDEVRTYAKSLLSLAEGVTESELDDTSSSNDHDAASVSTSEGSGSVSSGVTSADEYEYIGCIGHRDE